MSQIQVKMEEDKKEIANEGAIIIHVKGEHIHSKVQFGKINNLQVSLILTQLDLLKKKILDQFEKKSNFRMETK